MKKEVETEITQFASMLLHKYYCENDVSFILNLIAPDISWIGAGEKQHSESYKEIVEIFTSYQGSIPKCNIEEEKYHVIELAEDTYLCSGMFWIATDDSVEMTLRERQRVTFIFRRTEYGLQCVHIHNSNPYQEMVEGEAFPNKLGRSTTIYLQEKMRQMEQQLFNQEQEIEELTANMYIGIVKCTLDGKLLFISESCLKLLGYTREEYMRSHDGIAFGREIVYAEDYPMFYEKMRCLWDQREKSVNCECRLNTKDALPIWVAFGAKVIQEFSGKTVYCFITDISKIKMAVELQNKSYQELAQKNHQMEVVLNAIYGGLKISLDDDMFTYAYVSDELCNLFGYTKEEYMKMCGGTAVGAVYPPDLPRVLRECEEAFRDGGLNYAIKYRIRCKDGSLKWIIDSGRKIKNDVGEVIINSIYLDVNDKEQANLKIIEQKELLDSIYDSVLCGILRYRLKNGAFEYIKMNHEALKILDYRSEEECFVLGKETFYNRFYEEDRASILFKMKQFKKIGDRFREEYRILTPSGQLTWIYGTTELIPDVDGECAIQCIMIDITEKKKLELALEEERQRFRIAIENTPAIIFEYDLMLDRYITYGTLEKTKQEHDIERIIDHFLETHLLTFIEDDFQEKFCLLLRGDGGKELELRMAPFFGSQELVWAKIIATPIFDDEKRVVKMIGKISNIQSEKEKEFALAEEKSRDGLTGLYKKDTGIRMVKDYMEKKSPFQICGLMLLDMDDFKKINEEEGSVFADAILQEVAAILRAETGKDDIQIRLGGDEFMLFVKDCNKARATVLGPHIAELVGGLFATKDRDIKISVSIGMCVTEVVDEYSGLYRCAESTLKYVKANARGQAACYLDTSNELGTVLTQLYKEAHFINEIDNASERKEVDLTSFALELLGKAKNLNDATTLLLSRVGKSYGLDRVSIMEVDQDYLSYRFTYQWAKNPSELRLNQEFYFGKEEFEHIHEQYDEEGLCEFHCIGKVHQSGACLHAVFWNQGIYAGALVFDKKEREYRWSSEQRKLIKELAKIVFSFILKARADAVSQAKTDFLSRMSHEIRTPMNAIAGMTTIAKSVLDDKSKTLECLNKIETANTYLLDLINDVLDMSRIESGKMEINEESIDLKQQIDNLESLLRPQAEEKRIHFTVENGYRSNRCIRADALRLHQVLVNIIGNAVKFTEPGGTVMVKIIPVKEDMNGVSINFSVKDTGIGISKEAKGRIFGSFEQAGKDTASTYGGTGLGLSISNRLVQMMGGTLEVNSELGKGSEFYFTLHFAYATDALEGIVQADEIKPAAYDFHGKCLLVAEDNELNREIAVTILEMYGFVVEAVTDGKRAVDCFVGRHPGYYDAILMDIRMPVMDGLEATKRIRTSGKQDARNIPIIAMTANAFSEDMKKSMESGMDGHLSKPIEIDQLFQVLQDCMLNAKERGEFHTRKDSKIIEW